MFPSFSKNGNFVSLLENTKFQMKSKLTQGDRLIITRSPLSKNVDHSSTILKTLISHFAVFMMYFQTGCSLVRDIHHVCKGLFSDLSLW